MSTPIPLQGTLTVGPYQGYYGRAEYEADHNHFHGVVTDTRDVITFVAESPAGLCRAFRDSIDEYLSLCAERGVDPEKPFSGNFLVRAGSELHRQLSQRAALENISLNQLVVARLRESVDQPAEAAHGLPAATGVASH